MTFEEYTPPGPRRKGMFIRIAVDALILSYEARQALGPKVEILINRSAKSFALAPATSETVRPIMVHPRTGQVRARALVRELDLALYTEYELTQEGRAWVAMRPHDEGQVAA